MSQVARIESSAAARPASGLAPLARILLGAVAFSAVAGVADAVIIGTRMIQVLDEGDVDSAPERAASFIGEIRAAIDQTSLRTTPQGQN